ncbi:putative Late nodulin [Medicago truncatula]|uniref:Nodule Cysteine-Rich (NCR) secreted peptide n=1 Tax=Medicago truncatula TaxID=3880 RepID=G7J0L3_MEDTR|nr:unknown [Medicago truncatula]KEH33010.1 Nodule Cysteine-Rich (NCR) secreted peptide [Medicago truncatula]RHN65680.1 putative Late nodulin [Medicago truncatula]
MSKTIMFLYAMTLFLFLLHIEKSSGVLIDCKTVKDCPPSYTKIYRCIDNKCRLVL